MVRGCVVLLKYFIAIEIIGIKVMYNWEYLEVVFILVNTSIALLLEVPRTLFTTCKTALEYLAIGLIVEKCKIIRIFKIVYYNLSLLY